MQRRWRRKVGREKAGARWQVKPKSWCGGCSHRCASGASCGVWVTGRVGGVGRRVVW